MLASNIDRFAKEITEAYLDIKEEKSYAFFARKRSLAIYNFLKTGKVMTIITMPGPAGAGIGGIDKPAPGMGLDQAVKVLAQELIAAWQYGTTPADAIRVAKLEGKAIMNFMLQAKVMTVDLGPITPPTFSGPTIGTGGLEQPLGGIGLDDALPILEKELIGIWNQVKAEKPTPIFAQQYAMAILKFTLQAKVDTTGVVAGGAGASISGALT